jgi:tetratricopeptide (TPR) repeat protein
MIDEALFLYREAGHGSGIAKSLIQKAKIVEETGDLRGAIDLLRKIEGSGESCTLNYARYNLLGCLVLAERFDEAEALLPAVRSLLEDSAQPVDRIRLRWTEGLIALGRGRRGPAEAAFREVQRQFLERRMGYDAALVSLDLARLYAQEGCVEELKRLANELFHVFESRDVHREAIIALLMIQKACEEERLTVELVREIAGYLRRERRGPNAL